MYGSDPLRSHSLCFGIVTNMMMMAISFKNHAAPQRLCGLSPTDLVRMVVN